MKKHWQKIPYWMRGGVVAVTLATLSWFSYVWCIRHYITSNDSLGFECLLTVGLLWFPVEILHASFPVLLELPEFMYYVIGIMVWFILGGSIAGVVSRIKKRTR